MITSITLVFMSQTTEIQQMLLAMQFSEKESRVYLALLELGRGTVSEIARKANINRTTGYDILDALVSKGLASVSGKEPKQEYAAESPDRLLDYLRSELAQREKQLEKAQTLVPQLKSMHAVQDRPRVRFYEGTKGIEEVYEDTLTATESIRAYANVDDMHKALPHYFPQYYKRRTKKGIAIRAIIPENEAGMDRANQDRSEMRESALVPIDKYYFSPEINIYDNKVMIASWREKLGVIIESSEIAEAMKQIYELAWAEAKRLDKELRGIEKA